MPYNTKIFLTDKEAAAEYAESLLTKKAKIWRSIMTIRRKSSEAFYVLFAITVFLVVIVILNYFGEWRAI